MSSAEAITLKLSIGGVVYDFATIEPLTNDYSIFIYVNAGATPGKERRISYHPTGVVVHHDLATSTHQYFEPLCTITGVNFFLACALDPAELSISEDQAKRSDGNIVVLEMASEAPFVGFALAPESAIDTLQFNGFAAFRKGFAIVFGEVGTRPDGFWPGTWAFAPEPKLTAQAMSRDQAELAYVRMLYGTDGMIVTPPNGEHYRTHYPPVTMSRVPEVVIKDGPQTLVGEVHPSSKAHKVKIRFVDKSGVIKSDDATRLGGQMFLNARLRMPGRE